MGILKWLFGGGKKYEYGRIEKAMGPWKPYEGGSVLKGTRIPKFLNLPEVVRKWKDNPGEKSISTALFPYWLRISPKMAGFLVKSVAKGGMYERREIPREGKEPRKISVPAPILKFVQKRILERVLMQIPPGESAHGFIRGRSIFSSASPHAGKRVVLKFDLKDFFPSITLRRVTGLFLSVGFDKKRARMLAGLCCFEKKLPQGAPTSPMISNLICRRLDSRLSGLVKKHGFAYTRYADDLVFSGDEKIIRLIRPIREIIGKEGFTVAEEKTRIMRSGSRQRVLGLNVNTKVSVPRKVRRLIRAMVHKRGMPEGGTGWDIDALIYGHIAFMKTVHPEQAEKLKKKMDEEG